MKDARYFPHDDNARNDPKNKALIRKYGMKGYGMFWIIIEMMRENTGHKIKLKKYVIEALAEQTQCSTKEVEEFIKDCIEEFELFIKEDDFIYSESLITRMVRLHTLRINKQKGAYAMHEKAGHNITKEPLYDKYL